MKLIFVIVIIQSLLLTTVLNQFDIGTMDILKSSLGVSESLWPGKACENCPCSNYN